MSLLDKGAIAGTVSVRHLTDASDWGPLPPMPQGDGVIRTTAGDLDPDQLGFTSMHEHVLLDARVWYRMESAEDAQLRDQPVTPANLARVRWHAYSVLDNLVLDDPETAAVELAAFRQAGGDAIVDTTTAGLGGDPRTISRIADATGVRVIMGAGHYVHESHEPAICGPS